MALTLISGSLHGTKRREYLADTDADFEDLPEGCPTASTAVSIESLDIMIVNSEGKWVKAGVKS